MWLILTYITAQSSLNRFPETLGKTSHAHTIHSHHYPLRYERVCEWEADADLTSRISPGNNSLQGAIVQTSAAGGGGAAQ